MRRAILHELCQPLDPAEPPPACKLQAVGRAVVNEAAQGDLTAAREILDRSDGKTSTGPQPPRPKSVFTWQRPSLKISFRFLNLGDGELAVHAVSFSPRSTGRCRRLERCALGMLYVSSQENRQGRDVYSKRKLRDIFAYDVDYDVI